MTPLLAHPYDEAFEGLRDAADAFEGKHGRRPRVYLAEVGSVAEQVARKNYASDFFQAGGFEALDVAGRLSETPNISGRVTIISMDITVPDRFDSVSAPIPGTRHLNPTPTARARLAMRAREQAGRARAPLFNATLAVTISAANPAGGEKPGRQRDRDEMGRRKDRAGEHRRQQGAGGDLRFHPDDGAPDGQRQRREKRPGRDSGKPFRRGQGARAAPGPGDDRGQKADDGDAKILHDGDNSLGECAIVNRTWIDRPVDTQGCALCFHVIPSAAEQVDNPRRQRIDPRAWSIL